MFDRKIKRSAPAIRSIKWRQNKRRRSAVSASFRQTQNAILHSVRTVVTRNDRPVLKVYGIIGKAIEVLFIVQLVLLTLTPISITGTIVNAQIINLHGLIMPAGSR